MEYIATGGLMLHAFAWTYGIALPCWTKWAAASICLLMALGIRLTNPKENSCATYVLDWCINSATKLSEVLQEGLKKSDIRRAGHKQKRKHKRAKMARTPGNEKSQESSALQGEDDLPDWKQPCEPAEGEMPDWYYDTDSTLTVDPASTWPEKHSTERIERLALGLDEKADTLQDRVSAVASDQESIQEYIMTVRDSMEGIRTDMYDLRQLVCDLREGQLARKKESSAIQDSMWKLQTEVCCHMQGVIDAAREHNDNGAQEIRDLRRGVANVYKAQERIAEEQKDSIASMQTEMISYLLKVGDLMCEDGQGRYESLYTCLNNLAGRIHCLNHNLVTEVVEETNDYRLHTSDVVDSTVPEGEWLYEEYVPLANGSWIMNYGPQPISSFNCEATTEETSKTVCDLDVPAPEGKAEHELAAKVEELGNERDSNSHDAPVSIPDKQSSSNPMLLSTTLDDEGLYDEYVSLADGTRVPSSATQQDTVLNVSPAPASDANFDYYSDRKARPRPTQRRQIDENTQAWQDTDRDADSEPGMSDSSDDFDDLDTIFDPPPVYYEEDKNRVMDRIAGYYGKPVVLSRQKPKQKEQTLLVKAFEPYGSWMDFELGNISNHYIPDCCTCGRAACGAIWDEENENTRDPEEEERRNQEAWSFSGNEEEAPDYPKMSRAEHIDDSDWTLQRESQPSPGHTLTSEQDYKSLFWIQENPAAMIRASSSEADEEDNEEYGEEYGSEFSSNTCRDASSEHSASIFIGSSDEECGMSGESLYDRAYGDETSDDDGCAWEDEAAASTFHYYCQIPEN